MSLQDSGGRAVVLVTSVTETLAVTLTEVAAAVLSRVADSGEVGSVVCRFEVSLPYGGRLTVKICTGVTALSGLGPQLPHDFLHNCRKYSHSGVNTLKRFFLQQQAIIVRPFFKPFNLYADWFINDYGKPDAPSP